METNNNSKKFALDAKLQDELNKLNIEKHTRKTTTSGNKSFWIWENAIKDFCTDSEIKKASESVDSKKQLMKKVRRMLRNKQYDVAFSFISALKSKSNNIDECYENFAKFNKRYIVNCKETFTNVTENRDKEKYNFLKLAYSTFNEIAK
jgi:hypothetical protein